MVSTSDSKFKQSRVATPLASTTGADICAYRADTAFDRPDLLDVNAQAPRRAPRMAGTALLAQLVEHLHGKEGVDGSSPSEGSAKAPHVGAFAFRTTCRFSHVRWVWSCLWSFRVRE